MKFKKDPCFNNRAKGTFFSLMIFRLNNTLNEKGEWLAKDLVKFPGLIDTCKEDFMDDFEYILTEMLYVNELATKDGIDPANNIPQELVNVYEKGGAEAILRKFLPLEFNYDENRYYTEDEQFENRKRMNKIANDILDELKDEK